MPEKNVSVTFRISSADIGALRSLAEEEEISLNTLVARMIRSFLEWESIAAKAGMAPMQKDILRELFSHVPDDELKKMAVLTADNFVDKPLIMTGSTDLDSVFFVMKNRSKRSGFAVREFSEPKGKKIMIQHDMGRKWSVFFNAYNERLINNAGYAAKIDMTDNSLLIRTFSK